MMNPTEGTALKLISKQQIKLIKTIQRQHLPDDRYYEILQNRFGVESCKDLTSRQASELIELFKTWGFMIRPNGNSLKTNTKRAKGTFSKGGNVIRLASFDEKEKIKNLASLIQWKHQNGLSLWIKKSFGISGVKSGGDAYLVIEGLKKMFENRMKKTHGSHWWTMNFEDEAVRRYIRLHCPKEYR